MTVLSTAPGLQILNNVCEHGMYDYSSLISISKTPLASKAYLDITYVSASSWPRSKRLNNSPIKYTPGKMKCSRHAQYGRSTHDAKTLTPMRTTIPIGRTEHVR